MFKNMPDKLQELKKRIIIKIARRQNVLTHTIKRKKKVEKANAEGRKKSKQRN